MEKRERIADCINILGKFCGKRDVPELTREALRERFGIGQADLMVLFGGSILCGVDVLADAIKSQAAKRYLIVGGAGHTTQTLRDQAHREYPQIETAGRPEAEVFAELLKVRHGLGADFLECASTNCGNNITNLLALIRERNLPFRSVILAQDATMQHRMEAGLRRYVSDEEIINFATYRVRVCVKDAGLVFEQMPWGMWEMERYLSLLLGEIPRLSDTPEGYGPRGKGFIAHVEIPPRVEQAFLALKEDYADLVREADPAYA